MARRCRSEAFHVLNLFDFLQVAADVLNVSHVVYAKFYLGSEESVARLDVQTMDVYVVPLMM